MPDKPATADGYRGEHVVLVRATCLYLATKLGDLMDDLVAAVWSRRSWWIRPICPRARLLTSVRWTSTWA